jgi:hypothetical protein
MLFAQNTGQSVAYSVREISGGGYIIGGTMGNYYPLMIRTDAGLNTNWCYYYANFGQPPNLNKGFGYSAISTSDGGFAMTGSRSFTPNPATYMSIIKTNSLGVSGCNQGIPIFGGSASTFTYTHTNGTLYLNNTALHMAVNANETNLTLPDSTLCSSTSLDEHSMVSISYFPNPVNDFLNVALPPEMTSEYVLEIRDISGRIILEINPVQVSGKVDVSMLQRGVYILQITNKNKSIWNTRFIKI